MTDMRDHNRILDLLDRTLETYGADSARWPAGVRVKLQPLIAENHDAQRMIAEARALDKVLGFAPEISAARQADLAKRIVERAERQPRAVASNPLPANVQPGARSKPQVTRWGRHAVAASALAASLMLGILAGQNATVVTLAEAALTGGDASETSNQQVAQSDDIEIFWDEDLL